MSESIVEVLRHRDGLSLAEAQEMVDDARDQMRALINAGDLDGLEELLSSEFGLEPDYLDEILLSSGPLLRL